MFALVLVVLSLIGFVRCEKDGFLLKLLDPRSGASCLDGTPGGFYLRPSKTNSPNWIVHFQGGGWCLDEQDCLERSKTDFGSSAHWPAEGLPANDGRAHGALSSDPFVNPNFHDWNMVHINYCDGASYAGFKQDPIQIQGQNLHFRGAVILNEVFKVLLELGLSKAENLVVSGTSAGGLAVYIHIDYIRSIIPKNVRVVGFPDSGVFLNMTSSYGPSYTPHFEYVFKMQNITSWTMNQGCFKEFASQPQKCFFAQYVLPYVTTPMFMVNSNMDTWGLANIAQIPCLLRDKNLNNCTTEELFHVRGFETAMSLMFRPFVQLTSIHGSWFTTCVTHGGQDDDFMFSKVHIQSISMSQAFGNWFSKNGKPYTYEMEDFPWPNGCKSN
jgi:hypothetical protein